MATNARLERDIFGGSDSELSEDDDLQRHRDIQRPGAYDTGSEDNYADEAGAGKPKKKRAPRGDPDGAKIPRKRKKKRRDSREAEEPAGVDLDPEQLRRLALNQQIDAIVKPTKSRPKKRKKQDAEEDLDRAADEEVVRLRDDMIMAADADEQSNREKRPATGKLRMLQEVMETLQKQSHHQAIFDNNLLQGVRRWLEPLPDKSLPALNIQKAFFEVLPKMDIDTNTLKEAGLGKIVLFYTRCKRVSPPIKRAAETLVDIWSRPIIKRSSSYRDREIPLGEASQPKPDHTSNAKLNMVLSQVDAGRTRKNAVRIPERDFGTYSVAPRSNMAAAGPGGAQAAAEVEKRRANADRLRKMQRMLAINKQKNSRL